MGVALLLYDDVVAVKDAGVDHRLSTDAQHEGARVPHDVGGEGEVLLDVLLGEDGDAGSNASDKRERDRVRADVLLHAGEADALLELLAARPADLDGPRLVGIPADIAGVLKLVKVGVHGGRRGEADCPANLTYRRRVPVSRREAADEVIGLLLALGNLGPGHGSSFYVEDIIHAFVGEFKHLFLFLLDTNMCAWILDIRKGTDVPVRFFVRLGPYT